MSIIHAEIIYDNKLFVPLIMNVFLTDARAKSSPSVTCILNEIQLDVIINIVCNGIGDGVKTSLADYY